MMEEIEVDCSDPAPTPRHALLQRPKSNAIARIHPLDKGLEVARSSDDDQPQDVHLTLVFTQTELDRLPPLAEAQDDVDGIAAEQVDVVSLSSDEPFEGIPLAEAWWWEEDEMIDSVPRFATSRPTSATRRPKLVRSTSDSDAESFDDYGSRRPKKSRLKKRPSARTTPFLAQVSGEAGAPLAEKPFACPEAACSSRLSSKQSLARHIRRFHRDPSTSDAILMDDLDSASRSAQSPSTVLTAFLDLT